MYSEDHDNDFVLSSEDELAVNNPSKIPREEAGSDDTNFVVLTDDPVILSDAELAILIPPQLPPETMSLVTFPIEATQPTKIPGNIVHKISNIARYFKKFLLQDSPDARRKKCLEGAEKRKSVNPVVIPPSLWSSIELSMPLVPAEPATLKGRNDINRECN